MVDSKILKGYFLSVMVSIVILSILHCSLTSEDDSNQGTLNTGLDDEKPKTKVFSMAFMDENLAKCVSATGEETASAITELACPDMDIRDLSGIEQMTNLKVVDFSSNPVSRAEPLGKLGKLESANLDSTKIESVDTLSHCKKLKVLSIRHTDVDNLEALRSHTALRALFISGTNPDWASLYKMKKVTNLDVSDCHITNLKEVRKMTWLLSLDLSHNDIESYEGLKDLLKVSTLSLSNNNIEDPSFLKEQENVEELDVSHNNIKECDVFSTLQKLRKLNLAGNETNDITPLSLLKNLRELNMGRNRVRWGVYTLSWLVDMERVDLTDNDDIPCDDLEKLRDALGEEAVVGVRTCVENPTMDYCGKDISIKDHRDILNHTFIMRSVYSKRTEVQGLFFVKFVAEMILNGINFSTVSDYNLSFKDNQYRWGKDGDYLFFTFVFTKDFGKFKAGDTIPYNLTELETYIPGFKVKAPDISVSNPLKSKAPSLDITKKGPLFELVDYHLNWDGLKPRFRVTYPDLGTIGVSMGTHGFYTRAYPDTIITKGIPKIKTITDSLAVNIYIPNRALRSFKDAIDSGKLEIKFNETEYKSNYFKIHQIIPASSILLNFSKKSWTFDGTYQSVLTQKKGTFYTDVVFSNVRTNKEFFYCDEDHTEKLGTARNHQYLPFGEYTAENGGSFYYILMPF